MIGCARDYSCLIQTYDTPLYLWHFASFRTTCESRHIAINHQAEKKHEVSLKITDGLHCVVMKEKRGERVICAVPSSCCRKNTPAPQSWTWPPANPRIWLEHVENTELGGDIAWKAHISVENILLECINVLRRILSVLHLQRSLSLRRQAPIPVPILTWRADSWHRWRKFPDVTASTSNHPFGIGTVL